MNPPPRRRVDTIESWFRIHGDDDEFCRRRAEQAPILTGDHSQARTIIYTTKPHSLPRVKGISELPQPVATIGQTGLPVQADLKFLAAPTEPYTRIFIGDADPPGLLVFAWLREHIPITWYGVTDDFLVRHGSRDNDLIRIRLSPTESTAVPLLSDICPDYRQLLGDYCSSLLDIQFKIEVEGAVNNCGPAANRTNRGEP